ncbi:hypothetical protein WN944_015651 [Citrus x changshan-huyou]|uniref:Uncharacterized protein n=1 Tax=Citrus x changshan-huyou TaxID=2935761 RepID=A0AAP0M7Y1_9ROSI
MESAGLEGLVNEFDSIFSRAAAAAPPLVAAASVAIATRRTTKSDIQNQIAWRTNSDRKSQCPNLQIATLITVASFSRVMMIPSSRRIEKPLYVIALLWQILMLRVIRK